MQKKLFLLALILLAAQLPKAQQLTGIKSTTSTSDSIRIDYLSANQISITDSIVNYGKMFLNTPYRYGSNGTSSFDCSGFTSYVFRNFGYNLERSSSDQARQFDTVQRHDLKCGDLVFFSGRRRNKHVGHVGIVTTTREDGNFNFIHASVGQGVIISCSDEDYYSKRFLKANRVICNNQMLACAASNTLAEAKQADLQSTQVTPAKPTKKIIPAKYHRVKAGENLTAIAQKNGISLAELKRKNNIKGSKINPGQRLKIKDQEVIHIVEPALLADNKSADSSKTATASKQENIAAHAASTLNTIHEVKKGETLFSISALYQMTTEELAKLNNITNNSIYTGQKLKLQAAPAHLAATEPKARATTPKNVGQEPKVQAPPTETALVANTQTQPKQEESTKKAVTYEVKPGESLYTISKALNITVDEIKRLNNLQGSRIQAGQVLNLAQTAAKPARANPITHKISAGESFYSIAKTYGCTIENLKEWNNKSDNNLKPGEKLIIHPKTI